MKLLTKSKKQQGQILILAVVVVSFVLINTLVIIAGSRIYADNTNYSVNSNQALGLAEAGVDKALASLNKSGGTYSGEVETFLGDGSYSVTMTSPNPSTKIIEATGYIPSKETAKTKRTIQIQASIGEGVSFNYGVQAGEGGFQMGNNNTVQGSIYSNGDIITGNNNSFTGDVWVAGGVQPTPNQETDCIDSSCDIYIFGKNVAGQERLNVAQGFSLSSTSVLTKISIKIKKYGNPADATVRILGDASGNPNKSNILATGTLRSSLATTEYGWIDVSLDSAPNLTSDTPYWIMITTIANNNNYWIWQNDTIQSYSRGRPKWSPAWNVKTPVWSNITGDLSFKAYIGGVFTKLASDAMIDVGGDVHANTIVNADIQKNAYFQTISGSTVHGTQYPASTDPAPIAMPISEANIAEWKSQAQSAGNVSFTSCSSGLILGPGKIIGSISLGSSCDLTIKTPLWITGDLTFDSSNKLTLDSSYGYSSGVIISDGIITLDNNNNILGTGSSGSALLLLSTYDSRINGISAIVIKNNGNTGVLYAGTGIIDVQNSNVFKEMTAWRLVLKNNIDLVYESGLASLFFNSGPGGSYSLVKGTYKIN